MSADRKNSKSYTREAKRDSSAIFSLSALIRRDAVEVDQSPWPWGALVPAATRHGVAGLLLQRLRERALEPPDEARSVLERAATLTAAGNLQLRQRLGWLLAGLAERGIEVLLLKGAALNLTLYERPDLRPSSDLDLLVRPGDAARACETLLAMGCRLGDELLREDFFPRYHYEREFFTDGPHPARIDLHVRPFRPLRLSRLIPDDALWQGAQQVRVGTATAFVPSDEHMLLHLAAHAAFHGCERLIWLYDLIHLADARASTLDWKLLVRRTREWALMLPVRTALHRAAELFGPAMPDEVLNALGRYRACWQDRLSLWHAPRDATSPLGHVLVNLLCTPGLRFRAGYLRAVLAPGVEHLAGIYPGRHRGWQSVAHLCRVVRAGRRLLVGT